MAQAFLHGNGGTNPLNFKVVGSPTAPSNPKENTIWVKTSVAMPAWELSEVTGSPSWSMSKGFVYVTIEGGNSTGGKNFNAIKASNKTMFLRVKGCIQNQDGTASGWKKMNAYIYKSGSWVQFSSEFAATIKVTYPSGSTLTCSDGTTTLTATTTTGSYTFTVPNTGTWTVSCTNGTNTASNSVSITADGQSESVTLSYAVIIFKNGAFTKGTCTSKNGTSTSSYSRTEISGNTWLTVVDYHRTWYGYTTEKYDLTNVDTLYVTAWKSVGGSAADAASAVGVSSSQNTFGDWAVISWVDGDTSLDVSKLSGKYYFCVYTGFSDSGNGKNVQKGITYIGSEAAT